MEERMEIGIIGGSDGPTSIYVTSHLSWYTIAAMVLAVIAVVTLVTLAIIKQKRHK